MDKISVVIPSYNSRATIGACVQSVIDTGYRPLEVVVVDDASSDETPDIVEALSAEHPGIVRLERLERNGGPSRARNHGARAATGRYYFFLDSDTAMEPDALDNFVRRIAEADTVSGLYHWEPLNDGPGPRYKAMLNYHMFSRQGVFEYEVFNGAVGGMRAETFDASGGYDEDLAWGMDYENEEFGHRLDRDHRMVLDPAIAVRHAFPGLGAMSRGYFSRVALWMEMFMRRRRFEAGPASGRTGLATVAAPAALATVALVLIHPAAVLVPLGLLALYLAGYGGFFAFVASRRPSFLLLAVALNVYFSTVIAAGAAWGALRVLAGRARIEERSVTPPR